MYVSGKIKKQVQIYFEDIVFELSPVPVKFKQNTVKNIQSTHTRVILTLVTIYFLIKFTKMPIILPLN